MYLFPPELMKMAIFKLLYYFYKIIGLMPLNLLTFRILPTIKQPFRISNIGVMYNIFLVIVILEVSYFSIMAIFDSNYRNKSKTILKIEVCKGFLGLIIMMFLWLWTAFKQKKLVKLSNKFLAVNYRLAKFKLPEDSQTGAQLFIWLFMSNFIIWISLFITETISYDQIKILSYVALLGPDFIYNWLLLLFAFNVISLRMQFETLNKAISRLSFATILSLTERDSGVSISKLMGDNFLELKRTHLVLYKITCEINEFHSIPALVAIADLFASIVYNAYYILIPLLGPSHALDVSMTLNSVFRLAMNSLPIAALTLSIELIQRELRETSLVIHQLLAERRLSIKLELEMASFSMELLHRMAEFTASGIIPLNGSLLQSIVSATFTYLIILIQFHEVDPETNSHSSMSVLNSSSSTTTTSA